MPSPSSCSPSRWSTTRCTWSRGRSSGCSRSGCLGLKRLPPKAAWRLRPNAITNPVQLRLLDLVAAAGLYQSPYSGIGRDLKIAKETMIGMLAAAAQRTSRLRLGTLITILSLYHPMRVIEEAVTLPYSWFSSQTMTTCVMGD